MSEGESEARRPGSVTPSRKVLPAARAGRARGGRNGPGGGADGLGERLRAARLARSLSLRELAERSGLSRAFLSQVEHEKVSPSVASLSKIAEALGITMSELFLPPHGDTEGLVRASERVRMVFGENRFVDEVLSPSLEGKLLVLRSTLFPRSDSGPAYSHDADEECVVVLEGRLDVQVGDAWYELGPGDALTYASRRPHAWRNPTDEETVAIWVITPPRY